MLARLTTTDAPDLDRYEDTVRAWRHAIDHADLALLGQSATAMADLLSIAGRSRTGRLLIRDARAVVERADHPDRAAVAALRWGESVQLYRLGRNREAAVAAGAAHDAAVEAGEPRLVVRTALAYGWARKWTDGDPAQYAAITEVLPVAQVPR